MDKVTLQLMKNYVDLGHAIGYLPYRLKTVRKSVVTMDGQTTTIVAQCWTYRLSTPRFIYTILSYILVVFYQVFLLFRSLEAFLDKEEPTKEKLKIYYLTGIFIVVNLGHWIHLKHYGRLHEFYNAVTNLVKSLKPSLANVNEMEARKVGFFKYFFLVCTLFPFVSATVRALAVFFRPSSKLLISSLFVEARSKGKDVSIWLKIPVAAFHFHVISMHAFMLIFQVWTMLWFVRNSELLVEQLGGKFGGKVSQDLLYHVYHCLTLLQKYGNEIYGIVPLGGEIAAIFLCMTNLFMGVVHKDGAAFGRALAILCIAIFAFKALAKINVESGHLIDSWKSRNLAKLQEEKGNGPTQRKRWNQGWFNKFQRSCRPLRVSMAGFFYIDQGFILTFISIIIDQTTSLILSYRGS